METGAFNVVMGRSSFAGSNIGGIAETQEMLDFCFDYNLTAEIETINIHQVNEAFDRLAKGDVTYCFVIDMASLKEYYFEMNQRTISAWVKGYLILNTRAEHPGIKKGSIYGSVTPSESSIEAC